MDNARIIADEMCRHDIQMAAQAAAPIGRMTPPGQRR